MLESIAVRQRPLPERLVIRAARRLVGPAPSPAEAGVWLMGMGVSVEGCVALAAAVARSFQAQSGLALNPAGSPFVSDGEFVLLGEIARRQRPGPRPFRPGIVWPSSSDPTLDHQLTRAAAALALAGQILDHQAIAKAIRIVSTPASATESLR